MIKNIFEIDDRNYFLPFFYHSGNIVWHLRYRSDPLYFFYRNNRLKRYCIFFISSTNDHHFTHVELQILPIKKLICIPNYSMTPLKIVLYLHEMKIFLLYSQ